MLHKSAAFSRALSHSRPPGGAARSVVLSHKISTPPACWPGESKLSSGQPSTQLSANTVESRLANARCWCASCPSTGREKRATRFRFEMETVRSMGADYPTTPWEQWKKGYPDNENHRGAVSARSNGEQLDPPE